MLQKALPESTPFIISNNSSVQQIQKRYRGLETSQVNILELGLLSKGVLEVK